MDRNAFAEHLIWAEAEKLFPYRCSAGKLTIGVGRNLDDRGISQAESRFMLENDISLVMEQVVHLDYWFQLDEVRQLVIADMVFNLGFSKFLTFKKLNAALAVPDYTLAAHEMKDSNWYRQVGRRAVRLHQAMLTGEWNG